METTVGEENVLLLLSMGFYNEAENRRALKIAKNDINEAVGLLTNEIPGLHDSTEASTSFENRPQEPGNGQKSQNVELMDVDENPNNMEFPTTHLYDLESRVFTSSWNIPFKKDESLGRCLTAAVRFAKDGLAESEENCKRFLDGGCLRSCFEKLLTSYQVNRWAQDAQDGIFEMQQFFIDLICARLQYDPVPNNLLDILAMVFDPNTNFNQKNSRKSFDKNLYEFDHFAIFGNLPNDNFAVASPLYDEPFEYLLHLINRFGVNQGFEFLTKKFESPTLIFTEMQYLIKPFVFCVDFLNFNVVGHIIKHYVDIILTNAENFINDIEPKKGNLASVVVDLVGYSKILLAHLLKLPEEASRAENLQLSIILNLLKVSNFGVRMHALKELTKLFEMLNSPNKIDERLSISAEKLSQWLTDNEILSLALEGNMDHVQYCDRLRNLFLFLGPRLSCQDITKIWSLRRGRASVTVDNIHTIFSQTASKLGTNEFNHFLTLLQHSWFNESDRSKEKLIMLLGKIGQETTLAHIYEQVANLLWIFAHQQNLRISLLNLCMEFHLTVVTAASRENLRAEYINKCSNDIRNNCFVLPAITHLHNLVESIKKSGFNVTNSQKTVINDLVNKSHLVEALCDNLTKIHNMAQNNWLQNLDSNQTRTDNVSNLGNKNSIGSTPNRYTSTVGPHLEKSIDKFGPDFLLPDGFTYGHHVDAILDFLRFLLVAGELYLKFHRCEALWDTLVVESTVCDYAREAGFSWFLKGIGDLEKSCQLEIFQDRMLKLNPARYTKTGFVCFRKYFESVNHNEQKLRIITCYQNSSTNQGIEVEKLDLVGLEYLWHVTLNCPDPEIGREAADMLISLNFNCLSNRLKQKEAPNLHKKFLSECYKRLESASLTLKRSQCAEFLHHSAKILASLSVPLVSQLPEPDRNEKIRNIDRLLLIAQSYVKSVENGQPVNFLQRSILPHGASFFGHVTGITVDFEDNSVSPPYVYRGFDLLVDENESLGTLRERLSIVFGLDYSMTTMEFEGEELPSNKDYELLKNLGICKFYDFNNSCRNPYIFIKRRFLSNFNSFETKTSDSRYSTTSTNSRNSQNFDQERSMPGVIMGQDKTVFDILYQLISVDEPKLANRVRDLLLLIPTDPQIIENIDNLSNSINQNSSQNSNLAQNVSQNSNFSTNLATNFSQNSNFPSNSSQISGQNSNFSNQNSNSNSKSNSLERKICKSILNESISEKLASLASGSPKSKHKRQQSGGGTSNLAGPAAEKDAQKSKEPFEIAKFLLDLNANPNLNPFRLLYNLEALSARLVPTTFLDAQILQSARQFAIGFLNSGCMQLLVQILKKDYLPSNTHPGLQRRIYERVLQLLNFLLCDKSNLHVILLSQKYNAQKFSTFKNEKESTGGAQIGPQPLANVSTNSGQPGNGGGVSGGVSANPEVPGCFGPAATSNLSPEVFSLVIETLQRLAWSGAAGVLTNSASQSAIGSGDVIMRSPANSMGSPAGSFLGSPRNRTSESSTGSNSDSEPSSNLHNCVISTCQKNQLIEEDVQIAKESLILLVDLLCNRPIDVQAFFNLNHVTDFLLDILLVNRSLELRRTGQEQFWRLANLNSQCQLSSLNFNLNLIGQGQQISTNQKSLSSIGQFSTNQKQKQLRKSLLRANTGPTGTDNTVTGTVSVRHLMFSILLRVPLPLWANSSNARGSTRRLLAQCREYFALRGQLLSELTPEELATLQPSPIQMLDDEAHWILNFGSHVTSSSSASDWTNQNEDTALLAGHLELITVLLRLLPETKCRLGKMLIQPLLDEFLFPSAPLANRRTALRNGGGATETNKSNTTNSVKAKCHSEESRFAAFFLLLELCENNFENYQNLTESLLALHHQPNPELANEYDYSPLVDTKMDHGFVGLKNAGATCYMNSVLQQFLMEPGLADSILSVEMDENENSAMLFRELQRLLGHLKESEQQYYVPRSFWEVFKLWGQQVNPREQQDAFEFYSCLIDQIDEILRKQGKDEIFKNKYQGVFSDQKICQGCPHRYEREETFNALNLPVRTHNLEESLNNFVKGEILEGDNAYFCDKCGQKRTVLKRMCIKTLPPVVVIQLKRFNYDWEEMRSLKFNDAFEFPMILDFYPYTSDALAQLEGGEEWDSTASPLTTTSSLAQYLNSPCTVASSASGAALGAPSASGSSPFGGTPLSGGGPGSTRNRRSCASRLSLMNLNESIRYELVGVVVHSGQATAGHYYAYIKDRREQSVPNGTFNKWFKFNDTTVEQVEMTRQYMETELFGGKYIAKTDKNSHYPEERERYWNAYLLFYRRISNVIESKMPRLTSKRSVSMSCTTTPQHKNPRRRDSLMELAELVEQGEQLQLFSDRCGGPPTWLRQEICDENLKFAHNRDVFSPAYFNFVGKLCELGARQAAQHENSGIGAHFALSCSQFCLQFLLNTAWHCKRSALFLSGCNSLTQEKLDNIDFLHFLRQLSQKFRQVRENLVKFFQENFNFCREFLLFCTQNDIKQHFSEFLTQILLDIFLFDEARNIGEDIEHCSALRLINNLLQLFEKDAQEKWQNASNLFKIFQKLLQKSQKATKILLKIDSFFTFFNFLYQISFTNETKNGQNLEKSTENCQILTRKWTANQIREFQDVYICIALLMMKCDFSDHVTTPSYHVTTPGDHVTTQNDYTTSHVTQKSPPTPEMMKIFGGKLAIDFIKELIWAQINVFGGSYCQKLNELATFLCSTNQNLSKIFIGELLLAIFFNPFSDLRHVFSILEYILNEKFINLNLNTDTNLDYRQNLHKQRVKWILDGFTYVNDQKVEGILDIIKSYQNSDSRRSYSCVKFLSKMSEKCSNLKEALNQRLDSWQWAVDWLKQKMEAELSPPQSTNDEKALVPYDPAHHVTSSNRQSTSNSAAAVSTNHDRPTVRNSTSLDRSYLTTPTSNDDSSNRHFRRTVSAQKTLDRAEALLSEFVKPLKNDVICDVIDDVMLVPDPAPSNVSTNQNSPPPPPFSSSNNSASVTGHVTSTSTDSVVFTVGSSSSTNQTTTMTSSSRDQRKIDKKDGGAPSGGSGSSIFFY